MDKLAQHIESLIFTAESPISLEDIMVCLEITFGLAFAEQEVTAQLTMLQTRYKEGDYAFEIMSVGGGYQFMTKGAYHAVVATFLKQTTKKRLSQAALETLSIIAYKQPVSKTELEQIRGVSCDYSIQKLLEKELIAITGRSEGPGRPLVYGTSPKFMDYFGIQSLQDLPKPKDFKEVENTIGETESLEENKN